MLSRLQTLQQIPWTGGLVTAMDEALIGPDNLTRADNMYYTTQGTRRQREGIDENWDDLTITSVSRASSGTTRTLVTVGYTWTVGDQFTLSGAGNSLYNAPSTSTVTAIATTIFPGDTMSYTSVGSLSESATADITIDIILKTRIIAIHDYWYGTTSAKTHFIMMFSSTGQLYQVDPDSGGRTLITDSGTAYTIPAGGITRASLCTFENRLMVCCEGSANLMKHYMPSAVGGSGTLLDVGNTASYAATPKASFARVYLGRLYCNDKANPDRLHYSEVGVYNVWQGAGTSGAFDIGSGDGDPEGLTAIFPPFKGDLFVAKRTRLYRLVGYTPELIQIQKITDSLGCVGHQAAAAIDQDDIYFISDRGLHSLVATQAYGSFNSYFVSVDIQPTVASVWSVGRRPYIQISYLSSDNTLAVGVAEVSDSEQNQLYLYNVLRKKWFRWPSKNCSSVSSIRSADKERWFLGQSNGRIAKTLIGSNIDISYAGSESSVTMTLVSGLIFPVSNPSVEVAYKKISLMMKYQGSFSLTNSFKIDNFSSQSSSFSDTLAGDLLGSTFILGSSVWGSARVSQVYTRVIDGRGRGFKFTVVQSGESAELDLLGYQVFYEPLSYVQEDRKGDST